MEGKEGSGDNYVKTTRYPVLSTTTVVLRNHTFKVSNPMLEKSGADFDIGFYEGVAAGHPNLAECLIYLGNMYTANGMYDKGLAIDKKLSRLRPDDPVVMYNLACSYSLTNDIDMAISALRDAVVLGYDDLTYIEQDEDIDNIRNDQRYWDVISSIKEKANP